MSEPIIFEDPIPLNMRTRDLENWLHDYLADQWPSSEPSVWYHPPVDRRVLVHYRFSDCWIDLEATLGSGQLTITRMTCRPNYWKDHFEKLIEALRQLSLTPRQKPPHPPIGAPSDSWFDWYHVVTDELGYRMSLKDLAIEMGLSYGRVRHLHADYMEEHREIEETETAQK